MDKFERDIVKRLRFQTGNPKLAIDDILEWSTSEETVRKNLQDETEVYYYLSSLGIHCAVHKSAMPVGLGGTFISVGGKEL